MLEANLTTNTITNTWNWTFLSSKAEQNLHMKKDTQHNNFYHRWDKFWLETNAKRSYISKQEKSASGFKDGQDCITFL